jgi:colanic acid/amylovoran biosynthesis glycosyltransferase
MRIALLVDQFPELTETFVSGEARELVRQGHEVHVESGAHAPHPDSDAAIGLGVHYIGRGRGVGRLVLRHPLRCARDLLSRRRWRREEEVRTLRELGPAAVRLRRFAPDHLHAHFAAGAALDALRLSAVLGIPYSVMTHGYDIFKSPRNLCEKHARAAFTVTASEYSARHLRAVCPEADPEVLVMGVDDLRRSTPHRGTGTVVAVARLTEKKGLRHLVDAAQLCDRIQRVVIVGDGPLRDELRGPKVELLGARLPSEVPALIEQADVLVMPSVIASDGDRDTMPLSVKEALALEVPVVASDVAGLPEVVRSGWGRVVPPGDPIALARAIDELLSLPVEQRAAMGRAGREYVVAHCSRPGQTARLVELIASARA